MKYFHLGSSQEQINPAKYFVSGGFGGICTVLVGHPLDTIKVRLQTMPVPKPGEKPRFRGTLDCAYKTVRYEGILGLYKGMTAPLCTFPPIFAISFFGFGAGKKIMQWAFGSEHDKLTVGQLFFAGAFSGIFTTILMAPGDRVKVLLQTQDGQAVKMYDGAFDAVKKLYKTGGIRTIYKGTVATLIRDVPACGAYYLTYDWLQVKLANVESIPEFQKTIFAGGMTGIGYWIVGMPADVLKSRYQSASEGKYKGLGHVLRQLLQEEGFTSLYTGLVPVMLRAFPANAACWIGFEASMRTLNYIFPET